MALLIRAGRALAIITLSLVAVPACSWTLEPPRARDAATDGPIADGTDAISPTDTAQEAAIDSAIDAVDSATDASDAQPDAIDAPMDVHTVVCTSIVMSTAEADTVVAPGTPGMNHNGTVVNTSSSGLYGVWRFPVPGTNPLATATRIRILLHAARTDTFCGGPCPFSSGPLDLYPLLDPTFDETTATWSTRSAGMPWSVGPGGSTRGPRVATAMYVDPSDPLEFIIPMSSLADVNASLIGGKVGFVTQAVNPATFTAHAHESGMGATLIVESCH